MECARPRYVARMVAGAKISDRRECFGYITPTEIEASPRGRHRSAKPVSAEFSFPYRRAAFALEAKRVVDQIRADLEPEEQKVVKSLREPAR